MGRWKVLLLLLVLTLLGCAKQETYKYRIAVIPKGVTHEFWQSIKRGAEQAAADLHSKKDGRVKVIWDGPTREDEAQPQIDIINNMIAQGVDGIVLAPQHREAMVPHVEAAHQQGIPVVIIDSGLAREEVILKYIATDNYHGGQLAAQRLLAVLGERGIDAPRVVLFRYKEGSQSTEQREKGFEDHINAVIAKQKAKGEPTITWVSRNLELGATKDSAQANALPLLSAQGKEIDGIFAPNESSASGVVEVLRNVKLNNKIVLVGFDSSVALLQALQADDIHGLIVQDPYRMGYLGVWTIVHHLEGYDVNPNNKKTLSTGEHLVTKANLQDREIRELFDPDLQKRRTLQLPEFPKKK
jgi:ribose transport system substrate-binding protein